MTGILRGLVGGQRLTIDDATQVHLYLAARRVMVRCGSKEQSKAKLLVRGWKKCVMVGFRAGGGTDSELRENDVQLDTYTIPYRTVPLSVDKQHV